MRVFSLGILKFFAGDIVIKKRKNSAKKQDWQNRVSLLRPRDPVNPEASQHQKEATAEEYILCYLFRQPDALESVMDLRIRRRDIPPVSLTLQGNPQDACPD